MKIKRQLYCLTDKNNKPDYRFVFENKQSAQRYLNKIKNSIQGETIFYSHSRRDFFADGIKRNLIGLNKKIALRKGCWTSMKIKKVNLIDTIKPEKIFREVKKEALLNSSHYQVKNKLSWTDEVSKKIHALPTQSSFLTGLFKNLEPSFKSFDWNSSFLRTKSFALATGFLVILTLGISSTFTYTANKRIATQASLNNRMAIEKMAINKTKVLGAKKISAEQKSKEIDDFVLATIKKFKKAKSDELANEIQKIVAGSPMEKMVPLISQEDRTVAAFLVGIAKKESNFGRRVPVLNGKDCYNYWGYRGIRKRMGTGGHTCFDSPEDAIKTVGRRIQNLVNAKVDTPQEMVLWKCGSACSRDANASKWISDVNIYFSKINNG